MDVVNKLPTQYILIKHKAGIGNLDTYIYLVVCSHRFGFGLEKRLWDFARESIAAQISVVIMHNVRS